jgi:hypothetical protein
VLPNWARSQRVVLLARRMLRPRNPVEVLQERHPDLRRRWPLAVHALRTAALLPWHPGCECWSVLHWRRLRWILNLSAVTMDTFHFRKRTRLGRPPVLLSLTSCTLASASFVYFRVSVVHRMSSRAPYFVSRRRYYQECPQSLMGIDGVNAVRRLSTSHPMEHRMAVNVIIRDRRRHITNTVISV